MTNCEKGDVDLCVPFRFFPFFGLPNLKIITGEERKKHKGNKSARALNYCRRPIKRRKKRANCFFEQIREGNNVLYLFSGKSFCL